MQKLLFIIFLFITVNLSAVETEEDKRFLERELGNVAMELNKKVPKMVDKITRLEKVVAFRNEVAYQYSIITYSKADFTGKLEGLFDGIKVNYKNKICEEKSGYFLLEKGAVFKYTFNDKNGDFLSSFQISIKDCN